MITRLVVVAHHDREGRVHGHVLHHVHALRRIATRLVVVSNGALHERARAGLRAVADDVLERENIGYDFAMWRDALAREAAHEHDETLLVNTSVLGPFADLDALSRRMRDESIDVWGITDCRQHDLWHLQSYFLAFSRRVTSSAPFGAFFRAVLDYADKRPVVHAYELGLSSFLTQHGFRARAVVPLERVQAVLASRRRVPWRRATPMPIESPFVRVPDAYLEAGVPYLKVRSVVELAEDGKLDLVLRAARAGGVPDEAVHEMVALGARAYAPNAWTARSG